MKRMALFFLLSLLCLGCQYHYTLYIAPSPAPMGEPMMAKELPPQGETAPKPSTPLSIAPSDFQATQSQGGSMVNVLINLNLLKPTAVSTDTSLSGIPGF